MSSIEWTDETWNPTVGCSRVSKGCEHCYAEGVAHRGMSPQHRGLTVLGKKGPRWTGEVRFVESALAKPLAWKKPRRVFVNSMSDLFHESLTNEQIAAVFGVMAACPQHTFQVLTKRPERARQWLAWVDSEAAPYAVNRPRERSGTYRAPTVCTEHAWVIAHPHLPDRLLEPQWCDQWPLPNVWLGVSVEDQATADERIPLLLDTPAAVRFVSYEPALGPVDFDLPRCDVCGQASDCVGDDGATPFCSEHERECSYGHWLDFPSDGSFDVPAGQAANDGLVWIIVGGESGPGARPFDLAWARSVVKQCNEAGTPCFVKQLGAKPFDSSVAEGRAPRSMQDITLADRKGGDINEWPEDLRVRQFPERRS